MDSKEITVNLLTDLYDAYCPSHKERIPSLVERFNGQAFSLVDAIFATYNRKGTSFYNPEYDTNEFKINLVKEYDEGKRTFQGKSFSSYDNSKEIKPIAPVVQNNLFSNADIIIINNFTEFQVVLPEKEVLAMAGIGARIVAKKIDGGAIGLRISDLIVDIISNPGKTTIEVLIEK